MLLFVRNQIVHYFCGKFKIKLFCQQFMITHSEAYFVEKLRNKSLPQVQTPWVCHTPKFLSRCKKNLDIISPMIAKLLSMLYSINHLLEVLLWRLFFYFVSQVIKQDERLQRQNSLQFNAIWLWKCCNDATFRIQLKLQKSWWREKWLCDWWLSLKSIIAILPFYQHIKAGGQILWKILHNWDVYGSGIVHLQS